MTAATGLSALPPGLKSHGHIGSTGASRIVFTLTEWVPSPCVLFRGRTRGVIAQTVHLTPFRRKSEPPERFAAGFSGVGLNAKEEITGRAYNLAEFRDPNRAEVVVEK